MKPTNLIQRWFGGWQRELKVVLEISKFGTLTNSTKWLTHFDRNFHYHRNSLRPTVYLRRLHKEVLSLLVIIRGNKEIKHSNKIYLSLITYLCSSFKSNHKMVLLYGWCLCILRHIWDSSKISEVQQGYGWLTHLIIAKQKILVIAEHMTGKSFI